MVVFFSVSMRVRVYLCIVVGCDITFCFWLFTSLLISFPSVVAVVALAGLGYIKTYRLSESHANGGTHFTLHFQCVSVCVCVELVDSFRLVLRAQRCCTNPYISIERPYIFISINICKCSLSLSKTVCWLDCFLLLLLLSRLLSCCCHFYSFSSPFCTQFNCV